MEKELEVNNLKLTAGEQEKLRLKIIRTAKKNPKMNGKINFAKVAEICECSESHVRKTWSKYHNDGINAIKAKQMGRTPNTGKLNEAQQSEVKKWLVDKSPEQLKLEGFLWDRSNVQALIKMLFGVTIALQNISVYLKKWGFSPQKPIKRNYKQDPEKIEKWLNEEFPKIKERAKDEKAEIHWGDETGCQNECNNLRGYAPIGKTPTMPVGNTKLRINMISSITNRGKLRFMFYKGSMNAKILICFLRRLIKNAKQKIFLILDNLKVHHAILVTEWVKEHIDKIELFFLPPYGPEYNPDEYLNNNLKTELSKKGFSKTVDELESKARSTMVKFQKNPEHVAKFFDAKNSKYAK